MGSDAQRLYTIGQLVVADWPEGGIRTVANTIRQRPLGGYVFHAQDIASPESLRSLAEELWALYADHGWAPPWLAVTEEGGTVQRFRRWWEIPSALSLGELDDPDWTYRTGALTGQFLLASGINWNFAPVADVRTEARSYVIGTRSFGGTGERVARHATAWLQGQQSQGVLATVKHFPGHGMAAADSHVERPVVHIARAGLAAHLLPYRWAIRAGTAAVMTAHIVYPEYDDQPATLSAHWLNRVLRAELGFQGLIVTDALNMRGIAGHTDPAQAAPRAIMAGADVLDCGGTFPLALAIFDALWEWARDPRAWSVARAAAVRILAAKSRLIPPDHWPDWPDGQAVESLFARLDAKTESHVRGLKPPAPRARWVEVWASGAPPTAVEEAEAVPLEPVWINVAERGAWSESLGRIAALPGPIVLYADNLWKHPGLVDGIRERLGHRLHTVVAVSDPVDQTLFDVPCIQLYGNRARARRVAGRCLAPG